MGRAGQKSNGSDCLGVFREPTKTCKRGRTGKPVVLAPRYCKACGEQRCNAHCRCGRRGTHTAHAAPRAGSAPAGPSRPSAPPAAPVAVVAPVGRASTQTWELLTTETWYRTFCKDVAGAGQVELGSYVYDNPTVQSALLKRLRGRTAFELNLYVDSEQFSGGGPRLQKSRLRELRSAGARVYLCRGQGRQGSYHAKGAVVDRRFLYTGSANFTAKSLANEEFCFKLVGHDVLTVLQRMVQHKQTGKLWNGL